MNRQKGQGLVEFAIILPVLLLVIIASLFFGMMFADYLALNSMANRAAREASLVTKEDYISGGYNYEKVRAKFASQTMPAGMYKWNYKSDNDFKIFYEKSNQAVVVEMTAVIDSNAAFYPAVAGVLKDSALEKITVTYRMFSEEALPDKPSS